MIDKDIDELDTALRAALAQIRQLTRFTGVLTKLIGINSRAIIELLQTYQDLPDHQKQPLLDAIKEYEQELQDVSQELVDSNKE